MPRTATQFRCQVDGCGHTTTRKHDIDRHMLATHANVAQWACPGSEGRPCTSVHKQEVHFKTHWRAIHAGEDGKVFKCAGTSCDKAFSDPTQAKRHVKTCQNLDDNQRELREAGARLFTGAVTDYNAYGKPVRLAAQHGDVPEPIEEPIQAPLIPVGTGNRRQQRAAPARRPRGRRNMSLSPAPAQANNVVHHNIDLAAYAQQAQALPMPQQFDDSGYRSQYPSGLTRGQFDNANVAEDVEMEPQFGPAATHDTSEGFKFRPAGEPDFTGFEAFDAADLSNPATPLDPAPAQLFETSNIDPTLTDEANNIQFDAPVPRAPSVDPFAEFLNYGGDLFEVYPFEPQFELVGDASAGF